MSISDRIKSIGTYGVVLNEAHFKDLLFEVVPPPAVMQNKNTSNLIKMGFPKRLVEDNATFCVWYATITKKKMTFVLTLAQSFKINYGRLYMPSM